MTTARLKPLQSADHTRKARGSGHERRVEIIEAAKNLFFEEGIDGVTTRRIAERAGISQTGLYVYFPNKDAILNAIRDETFLHITALISRIADEVPPGLGRLTAIFRAYVDFAFEHPREYKLTLMQGGEKRPQTAAERDLSRPFEEQSLGRQCFLTFCREIDGLIADGVLRHDDSFLTAQTIWMSWQGVCLMLINFPNFPWAEREQLVVRMMEMTVFGLAAQRSNA
jgi:AcrR family transcriptional regulator